MTKEYISPNIETMIILLDTAVLSVSSETPHVEDFNVSDGKW